MPGAAAPTSAAGLHFSKMHGAGNDFVVLDLRDNPRLASRLTENAPELCRALADRRTGIGCDQILTIEPPRNAGSMASYRVWNADGSASQQCGNGARCVAAWLVRAGADRELVEPQPEDERASAHHFFLDSPTGTHAVEQRDADRFEVDMGVPEFSPQAIPLTGFTDAQDAYAIDIAGEPVRFGAVSMGNPHAVIEVLDVDRAPVTALAPRVQRDATFPQSVNIGFAEVVARDRIRLRVYERGVGETLACGSGACAAVAVLTRQGRVDGDRGVTVSLPGGELHIHYDSGNDGRIRMTGPAAFVYEGDWIS